ncbi:MAG: choice-of-anchor J domain-containing protein, partial [Candidatus Methanomethylophilaceae archaeon]|nr:choice-of-anchor J domain-containing protein [Candidatus Methanomethylophilaceae archaeon]
WIETFDASTNLPQDWQGTFYVDITHGNNNTNGLYGSFYSGANTGYLMTPPIGPVTANSVLDFEYRIMDMNSYPNAGSILGPQDNIRVMISPDAGISWDTLYTINQTNHVTSALFALLSNSLSSYSGLVVMIRLEANTGNNSLYIDFDNFTVYDNTTMPSCTLPALPHDLDTNVSINTSLVWQNAPGASGYTLYFGTDGGGVTPPSNIVNGVQSTSPFLPPVALTYSTTYYWQVIPFNSFGSPSGCPIWSFTTKIDPTVTTYPFFESFETSVPPFNWEEVIVNPSSGNLPDWTMQSTGSSPSCMPHEGTQMAMFNSYSCYSGATARLSTPPLDMTALTAPGLSFWMYHDDGYNTYFNEGIQVQVSTDGLAWNNLDTLIQRLATVPHWEQHILDLTPYAGQTIYLGFLGVSQYGNNIFMDEVSVNEASGPPPCASLSYPGDGDSAVSVTPAIVWGQGGLPSASGFRLYFGTDGGGLAPPTDIENGTTLASPYIPAAPLAYLTTYYWQVVPFNSYGDATGCPIRSFTTRNDPTRPLPWTENFDASQNLPADWVSDMYVYSSHGTNNSNALTREFYYSNNGNAVTPPVGPVTANTVLEFEYRIVNANSYPQNATTLGPNDMVYIMVSGNLGISYDTLDTISQSNHVPSTQFSLVSNSLAAYDGITVMVRAVVVYGTGDYYVDFDNFTIFDNSVPPLCATLLLPADGDTLTPIYTPLSWSNASGSTGYYLYFGTDGGGITTPTNIANGITTASPYQPTPQLNYSTTYYWQVVPFNSYGSPTGCPIRSFTTMADPTITQFPYSQSFEISVPPLGWLATMVNPGTGSTPTWTQTNMGSYPSCSPHEGAQMARFNSFSCNNGSEARLSTPPVSFVSLSAPMISFWMYHDDGYNSYSNEGVYIQASNDGLNWNTVGTLIPRVATVNHWEQHTVDLSAYAGQTVYLGILGHSQYGNDCYVDEVMIMDAVYSAIAGPDLSICAGGSAQLNVTVVAGTPPYSFLWTPPTGLNDPTLQNPVATPSATTTYNVQVTDANNAIATDDVVVTVNPLPTVTLNPLSTVCINWPPLTLTGGSPAGGTYSGQGVTGNNFNPGIAGNGTHTITYTYTATNGCTNSATQPLIVSPCIGLEESQGSAVMNIFPNPGSGLFELTVKGMDDLSALFILNAQGQVVFSEKLTSTQSGISRQIDLSAYPKGIYSVKLIGEKTMKIGKIVLK